MHLNCSSGRSGSQSAGRQCYDQAEGHKVEDGEEDGQAGVGDTNRAEYELAGSKPFRPYADRPMKMRYYDVPIATLEDAAALEAWAERSIAVAKATTRPQSRRK